MPMRVFGMDGDRALERALLGEPVGTLVRA